MQFLDALICWLFGALMPQPAIACGGYSGKPRFRAERWKMPNSCAKGASTPKTSTVYMASTPTVIDTTSAPLTETKADTQTAQTDALRAEAKKKGIQSTLLAGETGGYNNGKKTLLG